MIKSILLLIFALFVAFLVYTFMFEEILEEDTLKHHIENYQVEHGSGYQKSQEDNRQENGQALSQGQEDGQGM